ncbi:PREDICTED: CAAX prenyl protease 1 homolog [Nicrophorus vespilloides]|uniref:CAAX prenyl protease n=1 Tax=Nicrophorus vespilloides TaxID=110193 RepID=A0ABM1NAY0_NICVS|nr:PREDICTED: CAAX prenyl protease 1 homolog [Nicrophorus vespilloides]
MFKLTESLMLYGILVFQWIEYLWEIYLSGRQYKVAKKTVTIPDALKGVMTKETFDKARKYSMAKNRFGLVKDTFSIIVSTATIYFGVLAYIWDYAESWKIYEGEVFVSCVWIFILTTIQTIVELPLTIYNTFVLEEEYGFNKQTARFFIIDKIKGFILNQVLTLPVSSVAIVIVKYGGDYFFLWLWIAVGIISMVLLIVYPSYIAPRFDKYTPLPEGELRTRIEALATELRFPLTQLYVVEGSKRSSHSNAYFYGLFNSKRIVLFDTLLGSADKGGCNNDEVLAVISHELGHWSHGHVTKNLIIMQVNLFLMFSVFAMTFRNPLIYKAIGFKIARPVLVGLMVVIQYVMMPYNALISFLMTCLSRRFEFQADRFAMSLGKSEPLKNALVQLNKDNLGFPVYDPLFSSWYHSHPPLLERIAVLEGGNKKSE